MSISPAGKAFYWETYGKKLDPQATGLMWDMLTDRWDKDGKPTHAHGKASLNQPDHKYDVAAAFTFDEKGYKQVKLTLSGGSLPQNLTAEASRP